MHGKKPLNNIVNVFENNRHNAKISDFHNHGNKSKQITVYKHCTVKIVVVTIPLSCDS